MVYDGVGGVPFTEKGRVHDDSDEVARPLARDVDTFVDVVGCHCGLPLKHSHRYDNI